MTIPEFVEALTKLPGSWRLNGCQSLEWVQPDGTPTQICPIVAVAGGQGWSYWKWAPVIGLSDADAGAISEAADHPEAHCCDGRLSRRPTRHPELRAALLRACRIAS